MPEPFWPLCVESGNYEVSFTDLIVAEMLVRYVWLMGVLSALVGVTVSVTLARRTGKYKYCSKEAGSHCHGSSNLRALMDGAQCVSALRQLCSGASNQHR